jgi:hypothetical protein
MFVKGKRVYIIDAEKLDAALATPQSREQRSAITDDQIKRMVDRFLTWRLPENFNPDGGISFKPTFNEQTEHPMRSNPTGTNLFDAMQAEQMIRYLIDGIYVVSPPAGEKEPK